MPPRKKASAPPAPPADLAKILHGALAEAKKVAADPRRFEVYRDDPIGMIRDVFGIAPWNPAEPDRPGLTPDQVAFIEAAFRHRRVTARSGHGTGKSFSLALIALCWLYARHGLVVTTATTWKQVEDVLWAEVGRLFRRARVPLPAAAGHPLTTELKVEEGWFAVGRSTNDPTAFQGIHHPDLLVIIDEAPGVPNAIHEAIGSLATGSRNHIVEVGNPTQSSGEFYEHHRRGHWHRLHLNCLNHPNVLLGREVIPGAVTVEWVAEMRERYGEDSPVYQSRVLGDFPVMAASAVIPLPWAEASMATERMAAALQRAEAAREPLTFAVDVARYGDNRNVVAIRRGDAIIGLEDWGQVSTMETAGRIIRLAEEHRPDLILIDEVGVGGGVLDRLQEQGYPVLGFHSGKPAASRSLYANRRAEAWWRLREGLEKGRIALPYHDILLGDLTSPKYLLTSNGKIVIESKEDMRRRGEASPDFGDAVVMAFAADGDILDEPVTFEPDRDHTPLTPPPGMAMVDEQGPDWLLGGVW